MYILIKDRVTTGIQSAYDEEKNMLRKGVPVTIEVDVGHAVNTAAHAGAMIESRWPRWVRGSHPEMGRHGEVVQVQNMEWSEDPVMADWYDHSFRKVTCKVNEAEFEKAKYYFSPDQWFVVTESAFGGAEVALVFKPQREWPSFFKGLKLYS
jgi:hypothetical protein